MDMRYFQLRESHDYEGMFRSFGDVADYLQDWKAWIKEIRKVLKKNDRIVWFLRLYRIGLLYLLKQQFQKTLEKLQPQLTIPKTSRFQNDISVVEKNLKLVQTLLDSYKKEYIRINGMIPFPDAIRMAENISRSLDKFAHFFSLPIPEIQNYVFSYQKPDEIFKIFTEAEKKWQESRQGSIDQEHAEDGASNILSFPNGYAWWLLNRASCSHEAEAMGHCGNEPRANSDDRILSLRATKKIGKQLFYVPYCTFILESDGYLGEMKGKFNNSPKNAAKEGFAPSDFSNEIFALLKMPLIKGIHGGGYLPQENFKVEDLPENLQKELGKIKPQIMPLRWQYDNHGITPLLISQIDEAMKKGSFHLKHNSSSQYDENTKTFVWQYCKNIQEFIDEYVVFNSRKLKGSVASWCYKVINGDNDIEPDISIHTKDKEKFLDLLERKKPDIYKKLVDRVETIWNRENPGDDSYYSLIEMVREADINLFSVLGQAILAGTREGIEKKIYKTFNTWVNKLKRKGDFRISFDDYEGPIKVLVDVPTIIDIIKDDHWDNDAWEVDDIIEPDDGFSGYDEDAAIQYFIDKRLFR